MIYRCRYFDLIEIVYPKLFFEYKKKNQLDLLWWVFDVRLLLTADMIREFVDSSVTINTYNIKDENVRVFPKSTFIESGIRPFDTETGASLSQHKFASAMDLKFNNALWTPEKLRIYMEAIGCFKDGFKKDVRFNVSDLRHLKKDERIIDFVFEAMDQKVPKLHIPFVFMSAIEWLYKNRSDKTMGWFHFDCRNSISDKILIVK